MMSLLRRLQTDTEAAAPNRYAQLSLAQQQHVDEYSNALASGADTAIAADVRAFVGDAYTALDSRRASERSGHAWEGNVRHALAMILDTVMRPTSRDFTGD